MSKRRIVLAGATVIAAAGLAAGTATGGPATASTKTVTTVKAGTTVLAPQLESAPASSFTSKAPAGAPCVLPDGTGLQVTVFEILSSEGKPLNKVGVVPDEVIPPDPAAVAQGADPVIARAIEILHDQGSRGAGANVLLQAS